MKIVIGKGDGPTSVFVAGRLGLEPEVSVVLGILAVVIVAVAAGFIIYYIRKNRKDK
ncbi:MAG: hypothetical protein NC347_09270 [Clostridium sp.]|nr:hypothetical protein [Clostridium sp.]